MASQSLFVSSAIALLVALSGCSNTSNLSAARDASIYREKSLSRMAPPTAPQAPSAPGSIATNPSNPLTEDLTRNPVGSSTSEARSNISQPYSSASVPNAVLPPEQTNPFSQAQSYPATANRPAMESQDPRMGLALHLRNIGAKMYTTGWCPTCKRQERDFGEVAFAQIPKINCEEQPDVCADAGVHRYPTWEINGQKYEKGFPLEELAQMSNYADSGTSAQRY